MRDERNGRNKKINKECEKNLIILFVSVIVSDIIVLLASLCVLFFI